MELPSTRQRPTFARHCPDQLEQKRLSKVQQGNQEPKPFSKWTPLKKQFADTEGPYQNQRVTVAKIEFGQAGIIVA